MLNTLKPSLKIDLLLLVVALLWAASFGATKQALESVSVHLFIAIRFSISSFILLPWAWRKILSTGLTQCLFAILSGLLLSAIFYFEVSGVAQTSAANAAVLISLCVLMTPLIERITLGSKIPATFYYMVPLSLLGCCLLVAEQGLHIRFNKGDLSILVAALLRAGLSVYAKRLLQQQAVNTLVLTTLQLTTVAVLAWCATALLADQQYFQFSVQLSLLFSFLIVGCTLIAFALINYGLRHTSASRVVFITGSEPLFAVLFAVFLFGESISAMQFAGAGCIVAATYAVVFTGSTSAKTKPSRTTTSPT